MEQNRVYVATGQSAHRYATLLQRTVNGHALWLPGEEVRLGDCGTIHGGAFTPLFNVYNPPEGLPPLKRISIPITPAGSAIPTETKNPLADGVVSRVRREPTDIFHSASSLEIGVNPNEAVDFDRPRLNSNLQISGSSRTSTFAFLLPRGRECLVSKLSHDRTFELRQYLAAHYGTIRRKFHLNLDDLVMVHGCQHACGWVNGVAYPSVSPEMPSSVVPEAAVLEQLPRATPESLEASQPVGGLSSTLDADTGTSVAQDKLAPTQETNVLIDCSLATFPGLIGEGPSPEEWNANILKYCTVVQPVRVRKREIHGARRMANRITRAIGRFSPTQMKQVLPMARRNSDADQSLPMTVFTKPFALRRRSLDKVDEANADNPGDEYEDDILADLLDWVLETAKQFDTVTGDWSLITEFYKNSDGLRQGDDLRVEIQPHRLAGKVVGHVRAIAPGKVDTPAAAPVQLLYNPVGSSTSLHRPSGSRANSPVLSRSTSVTSETIGLGMTTSPLHSVRGSATSLDRADHSPPQSIRTLTRAPSPVSGAINAPAAATPLSIQSGFASFTPQPPEIVSSPSAPELHVQLASEETLATPVDGSH